MNHTPAYIKHRYLGCLVESGRLKSQAQKNSQSLQELFCDRDFLQNNLVYYTLSTNMKLKELDTGARKVENYQNFFKTITPGSAKSVA